MTRRRPNAPVNDNVVPPAPSLAVRHALESAVEEARARPEPYQPTDLELILNAVFHVDTPGTDALLRNLVDKTQNRATHDGTLSDEPELWIRLRDLSNSLQAAKRNFEYIVDWATRHGYDTVTGKRLTR